MSTHVVSSSFRAGRGLARFGTALHAPLLEPILHLAPADAEHLGRVLGRARGRLERLQDRRALELGQRHAGTSTWMLSAWVELASAGRCSTLDRLAVAQHDRALDRVLQLAHVAGPGVAEQRARSRRRSRPLIGVPLPRGGSRRKCCASSGMSLAPRAQRRHVELRRRSGGSTGPRGSARPRPSASRSRFVAATMRTSTAHGLVAADALELALLQHAQQLDLHRQRDLADLVEEQRAAVGLLEAALLARRRRR